MTLSTLYLGFNVLQHLPVAPIDHLFEPDEVACQWVYKLQPIQQNAQAAVGWLVQQASQNTPVNHLPTLEGMQATC